ncbi:MAG: SpoIIE family protein phosphatase [Methanomicrobiaceae archaeon]|nr:SpoIIE family protein phosphatase [Methanomicrobiaceae archaeon]
MESPTSLPLERLSLRHYLILVFVSIIVLVIGFLITSAYIEAKQDTIAQDEYLRQYTELNVRESLGLVNQGLTLYDNTLNNRMAASFPGFLEAYAESGNDPSNMDLEGLKRELGQNFDGELDLYVINETGVIVSSTVPEVMGLDFSGYPDVYDRLLMVLAGESFAADRVVPSVTNASDTAVTGMLRKFAYMPTPDHRYILEMGLSSGSFEAERADLSYYETAEKLASINPNLVRIRVFDVHKNVFAKGGIYRSASPDPEQEIVLDQILATRSGLVTSPDPHTTVKYLFLNQSDPNSPSDMSVIAQITYTDAILEEKLNSLLVFHLSLGFLAVLLGILSAYGASRLITKPINEIVEDVGIISKGELDHTIRSMRNAEFTILEQSINLMIRRIREESEELERKNAELKVAAEIQQSFLPQSIEQVPGFDLAALNVPAKMVGGDFYDIIPTAEIPGRSGSFGIIIADVSGKGLPAAIFMALSKVVLHANATWHSRPMIAIREANTTISGESKTSMFVTAFYGIIDPASYSFTYVNAGHNPPMIVREESDSVRELDPTGIALGALEGAEYDEKTVSLKSGDIIVLYTDGITEAMNDREELFGEERLRSILLKNRGLPADALAKVILDEIDLFSSGEPQSDDITLLIVKVL